MENKIDPNELEWKEGRVKNFFGKELLTLANGALKLVKIKPFSSYPEHIHPDKTEYVYVLDGHPHFRIDPEEFSAGAGEFYIFPSNTKHAIHNKTNEECVLLVGSIKN